MTTHRDPLIYYSEDDLARLFSATQNLRIRVGQRYWSVAYEVGEGP